MKAKSSVHMLYKGQAKCGIALGDYYFSRGLVTTIREKVTCSKCAESKK